MSGTVSYMDLLARVGAGCDVRSHSGKVRPGDVFVAVPGPVVDGAEYIAQAIEAGAAYIVGLPKVQDRVSADAIFVEHEDPARAVGELAAARYGRVHNTMPLVAVTGTNGKTTVSYLIESILKVAGLTPGVLGTISYRWPGVTIGASLTTPGCMEIHQMLAQMADAGAGSAVMEVSSHALHQQRVSGLLFDAAVITNLTQDHLDYHGDMNSYFEAKRLVFADYLTAPDRGAVNFDSQWGCRLLEEFPQFIGFGLGKKPAGVKRSLCGTIVESGASGMLLTMEFGDKHWELRTSLVGRFNAENLLAAQAACLCLGLDNKYFSSLEKFTGVPGRLERVADEKGRHVFVDYAHTPDALENVLTVIRDLNVPRLLCVFGCGGDRDRTKRPLMAEAVCRNADVAIITSDNPRTENPLAIIDDMRPGTVGCSDVIEIADRREAIERAIRMMNPGDVLVVAGKGHETYQQIGETKHPFSDVEVVGEMLQCV